MQIITSTGLDFDVNGAAFAAISLFAGREKDNLRRSWLWGVRIEPMAEGGALLIATNGHYLACYRDETATAPHALTVLIDKPTTGKEERLYCDENEGIYPDWRRVLPASQSMQETDTVALNSDYVSIFAKAAKRLGCKVAILDIRPCGNRYVIGFGDPNFHGVLMGVNLKRDASPIRPAFIDAPTRLAQAAE